MKKLLSFIAVTVTAATAVAAGAYFVKKLEQEKDEEVKLIEIINEDESEKKTSVEEKSNPKESFKELIKEKITEEVVEEQPVEEEAVVEEQPVEEVVEEQPVEEETVVEEVVEEQPVEEETVVEEVVEEQPVEEETVVEEVVEEQPVEEETVVEEVVEEVDPYHLLSERKKNAICNQISVMIESMEEFEEVGLQHYIVFSNSDATEAFLAQIEEVGYDIFVEENGQEVNLIKNSQLDRDVLENEILSLAQLAAECTGAYKGWAVKIDE